MERYKVWNPDELCGTLTLGQMCITLCAAYINNERATSDNEPKKPSFNNVTGNKTLDVINNFKGVKVDDSDPQSFRNAMNQGLS